MSEAAKFSVVETLPKGCRVEIRALRPEDRDELVAAVRQVSAESLYRRFFSSKKEFTDKEISFFVNIDFVDHVALVAVVEEGGHPIIAGGARYIMLQPGEAEVAFAVLDRYQGLGIGAALMRHLGAIARGAGLRELAAEVLSDNTPMLKVFEKSGFPLTKKRESHVVHVALHLC